MPCMRSMTHRDGANPLIFCSLCFSSRCFLSIVRTYHAAFKNQKPQSLHITHTSPHRRALFHIKTKINDGETYVSLTTGFHHCA